MSQLATYELDGRIATIRMDDGKVNAFGIAMLQELHAALDQAERDEAVVILTGREGKLSAGFDLNVFGAGDVDRVIEMLRLGARFAERVLTFPTPVVVASTGHALAAGSFALLAADTRIAADGPFQIGLNETRIGITLPTFVIELARRRLNPAHFDHATIDAQLYTPHEAIDAGWVDRVVAPAELRDASIEAANALAQLDPTAYAATKLRARGDAAQAIRDAIEREMTVEALTGGR